MDDIRDRVLGSKPDTIFHKIASIVPGYDGYVDRERRRDADKLLRTQLAHRYSAQRDRLNRVQQTLVRSHHFEQIAEVDRLVGVLQRFIDRLSTATYGYAGLFDPVKIEEPDLDQLYAFDMSLATGVDQVSAAVDSLEAAGGPTETDEMPAAISRLSTLLDELNARLNQRSDLLTSGRRLPENEYRAMVSGLERMPDLPPTPAGGEVPRGGERAVSGSGMSNEIARGPVDTNAGTPTTDLSMRATQAPEPGMSSITEGNFSFSETPSDVAMGGQVGLPPRSPQVGEAAGAGATASGIETASSPASQPGAPGGDVVEGLDLANDMGSPAGGPDSGADSSDTAPGSSRPYGG